MSEGDVNGAAGPRPDTDYISSPYEGVSDSGVLRMNPPLGATIFIGAHSTHRYEVYQRHNDGRFNVRDEDGANHLMTARTVWRLAPVPVAPQREPTGPNFSTYLPDLLDGTFQSAAITAGQEVWVDMMWTGLNWTDVRDVRTVAALALSDGRVTFEGNPYSGAIRWRHLQDATTEPAEPPVYRTPFWGNYRPRPDLEQRLPEVGEFIRFVDVPHTERLQGQVREVVGLPNECIQVNDDGIRRTFYCTWSPATRPVEREPEAVFPNVDIQHRWRDQPVINDTYVRRSRNGVPHGNVLRVLGSYPGDETGYGLGVDMYGTVAHIENYVVVPAPEILDGELAPLPTDLEDWRRRAQQVADFFGDRDGIEDIEDAINSRRTNDTLERLMERVRDEIVEQKEYHDWCSEAEMAALRIGVVL